jgi:hypothetical protein
MLGLHLHLHCWFCSASLSFCMRSSARPHTHAAEKHVPTAWLSTNSPEPLHHPLTTTPPCASLFRLFFPERTPSTSTIDFDTRASASRHAFFQLHALSVNHTPRFLNRDLSCMVLFPTPRSHPSIPPPPVTCTTSMLSALLASYNDAAPSNFRTESCLVDRLLLQLYKPT